MLKQSKLVIIFEIFRSVEVPGSIAIDDITFINCGIEKVVNPEQCDLYHLRCDNGRCINPYRVG